MTKLQIKLLNTIQLSDELRRNSERDSAIKDAYPHIDPKSKGTEPTHLFSDWFGTYLIGNYSGTGEDIKELYIATFEDLTNLNEEDSLAYYKRYMRSHSNGAKLAHIINLPHNIKYHFTNKDLSTFARTHIRATLLSQELLLRASIEQYSKRHKATARRMEIHRTPINKGFLALLELQELVAQKIVTLESPVFIREIVASTNFDMSVKLGVNLINPMSPSDTVFDRVYKNLSLQNLSIELINQSNLLDKFFVIDTLASKKSQMSVGLNPMPVLQRLPPREKLIKAANEIIELWEAMPTEDNIKDTNVLAEEDPNHDDFPRHKYTSTNPLVGDLVNKNYSSSSYDQSINLHFPEQLEYLAKLMRENKLIVEACPRSSQFAYQPSEYERWVTGMGRRRDTSSMVSLSLRINPVFENFLVIVTYGNDENLKPYTRVWRDHISTYLGSKETIDLVIKAQRALHDLYGLFSAAENMLRKVTTASLEPSSVALDGESYSAKFLKDCKDYVPETVDASTEDLIEGYVKENIGGFNFNALF